MGRGEAGLLNPFQMDMERDERRAASSEASDVSSCPLCKNHCDLSDPSCPKGEAYLNSLNIN